MAGRIEDYAIVGDMQSVALISTDGSVDWLCLPRFDSEACFAALLGTPEHGQWRIAPGPETAVVTRRYAGDTLILETDWETRDGAVRVTDFMPPRDDDEPPVQHATGVQPCPTSANGPQLEWPRRRTPAWTPR
jgi:GH15 family glucan-1,4-alpha-glucosidase